MTAARHARTSSHRITRKARALSGGALTIVGAVLMTLGATALPAAAVVVGSLTFSPASGLDTTPFAVTTSAACPGGTNVLVTVQGEGFPSDGFNVVGNNPQTAYQTQADGGLRIPISQTMAEYAKEQSPPATLSGSYLFTVICRNPLPGPTFGDFTGSIVFDTPTTYNSAGATPSPSASPSASPTASPSPSASPTASASASASASATPTASASPATTTSPSAGASPSATAGSSAAPASGTASATAGGADLGPDPELAPLDEVTVTAVGFAANEPVTVTLDQTRTLSATQADDEGVVDYAFTVPADLGPGQHRLVLGGGGASAAFDFTVGAATATPTQGEVPSTSTAAGTGGTSSESGGGGALPVTGSGAGALFLLGLTLLGGGLGVIFLGREGTSRAARAWLTS